MYYTIVALKYIVLYSTFIVVHNILYYYVVYCIIQYIVYKVLENEMTSSVTTKYSTGQVNEKVQKNCHTLVIK